MPRIEVQDREISFQGILFDKDGTLLQFMELWGRWADSLLEMMEHHLAKLGTHLKVDKSTLLGTKHDAEGRVSGYDEAGPLAMGSVDEVNGLLAWHLYAAAGVPWNEALQLVRHFGSRAMEEVRKRRPAEPMPGLIDFLKQCHAQSIPLGVVTADSTKGAIEHLSWMGILEYFQCIIGDDQVEHGKPHPEMVNKACGILGLKPANVIVIGDSNGDMQMGRQAGVCTTIGISERADASAILLDADVIIQNYSQLQLKS
ncbi:HAD family hydrolase [Paenibacillus sediminis]|uniref:Phosphoglycolate phosphatase n=1 Tax=Paenibacillus sediminis TaxID=664909 RepID=A0ABS4GY85_9BACL|nr:phosphoglycolate phosphatase [Paenibacillus sediminis]